MTRKHIPILVTILILSVPVIFPATPVRADGVVTNCSNDADFSSQLSSGGTITFNCGTAIIVLSSTKTITVNTTIDGGGTITLSGDDARRLFVVNNGVSLRLENIMLEKGRANYGGAIYNNGSLSLDNVTIRNSIVSENGGAISTLGSLDMISSTLLNNTAKNGGALFVTTTNAHITVTHSILHDNQAIGSPTPDGRGGAIFAFGGATVDINLSDIYSNTALDNGGALSANYLNTSVSVADSTFSNNRVANTATSAGGALWLGEQTQLTFTGGSIISNSAHSGGGLYMSANTTVTLTGAGSPLGFSNNSALSQGGGLENFGALTLRDAAFSGNSGRLGGGLDNNGVISLTNTTFNGNSVLDQGGGLANFGAITLANATFANNSAPGFGGGLVNFDTITLMNTIFANNSASYGGGGVYNFGVITLTNTTFANNSVLAQGGGLYNENLSQAILLTATFSGNLAGQRGGGIFNEAFDTSLQLVAVTLDGNSAGQGGGLANNGVITLTNTTLSNNRAVSTTAGYGGGLLNAGTSILIDATVSSNSANHQGGGIYTTGALTATNTTLQGNSAHTDGGGLWNSSAVNLAGVTFSSNSAGIDGGAIFNSGTLSLTNITLNSNSAETEGGGINNYQGAVSLTNVTLNGNSAGTDGGGLDNFFGLMRLTNATLSGNSAGNNGGGLYNDHGVTTLNNVTLSGNAATGHGGALYHIDNAIDQVTRLKNTIVANSPAGGNCFAEPGSTTGIISNGFNLSSDTSCSFNQPSDWNNVVANLGPLANNGGPTLTHIAFPPSKAVDNGSGCPTTDQRGVARPQGAACDIGAVEYVPGEFSPGLYLPLILR